jgi:hypothetical protein
VRIEHGVVYLSWCSKHETGKQVYRIWRTDMYPWARCLECEPELQPENIEHGTN